jgi:hypothetical protein
VSFVIRGALVVAALRSLAWGLLSGSSSFFGGWFLGWGVAVEIGLKLLQVIAGKIIAVFQLEQVVVILEAGSQDLIEGESAEEGSDHKLLVHI